MVKSVLTPAQAYFVDGFHQEAPTVYKFQGCWFHGCKRCFKGKRDVQETVTPIEPWRKSMRPL